MIRHSLGLFFLGLDTVFHRVGLYWPWFCNFAERVLDPSWNGVWDEDD